MRTLITVTVREIFKSRVRKIETVALKDGLPFPANGCAGHQCVSVVRQKEEHLLSLTERPRPDESMVRGRCKHNLMSFRTDHSVR